MTIDELKQKLRKISSVHCGVVHYDMDELVSMNGQFSIGELRNVANLVQRYLTSQQSKTIDEDNPDLIRCLNCDEKAYDGRICHICGAKDIRE